MAENLYSPPDQWYEKNEDDNRPLVFLAGPILGAEDWQSKAIETLHAADPNIVIANPRRANWEKDDIQFGVQILWETSHLRLASVYGVIMFWLAKETVHIPERAFAQTSRFELAEWITHYKYRKQLNPDRPLKVVLGIDNDFPGRRYLLTRIFDDCPEFIIATTLEETCKIVLENVR